MFLKTNNNFIASGNPIVYSDNWFNITVNNVLPGATSTVRLKSIIENKSIKTGHSVHTISEEMLAEIPMGRFAEASEVANAVAFLASPAASYINGINLPVDGGRTASL